MATPDTSHPCDLGVAIVTFQSAEIIEECLASLFASQDARLRVVVVDNDSSDDTCGVIARWAAAHAELTFLDAELGSITQAQADLTLLRSGVNGGFAFGSNRGLELLMADQALKLFWLVNPDARVKPDAAHLFAEYGRDGAFSLMGGRTFFAARPDVVQTDGGRVSRWTGVCESVNWGVPQADARLPSAEELDFITGANCVVSRRYLEQVGLMEESYFLYYEEVDWAFRRTDLPLRFIPEAHITHLGGTAIGTGSIGRRPSAFANYFNHRNRIRFMRRFTPFTLPVGIAFGLAKSVQLLLQGAGDEAFALLAGMFGMAPPKTIRASLSPEAGKLAFEGQSSEGQQFEGPQFEGRP